MYQVKVAYERQGEQGLARVTEQYLVDAMSFTEAEMRAVQQIQPLVSIGELEVVGIKRAKFADLLLSRDERHDRFYRAKVAFITLDEKTAQERTQSVAYLIQSDSLPSALQSLTDELERQLFDYRIEAIGELPIMNVYM